MMHPGARSGRPAGRKVTNACDLLSLVVTSCPRSSLCAIRCEKKKKKEGHFDHHPRWATQPNVCAACVSASTRVHTRLLPQLCVHIPCCFLFFCFASLQAQQLFLFRLALAEFFFFSRSTYFSFFFPPYLGPALFHQVCVSFSHSPVPSCEQQRSKPHTL